MPRKRTPRRPSGHDPRKPQPPSGARPGAGGGEWTVDDVQRTVANPFYAITCAPMLSTPHEPMMSRQDWVAVNARLIRDLGPERYLTLLLEVLEGGYVSAPPSASEDAGAEDEDEGEAR